MVCLFGVIQPTRHKHHTSFSLIKWKKMSSAQGRTLLFDVYVFQQTAISGSESTAGPQANGESATAAATSALVRPGEYYVPSALITRWRYIFSRDPSQAKLTNLINKTSTNINSFDKLNPNFSFYFCCRCCATL